MHYIEILPAGTLFPVVKKYLVNYSTPPCEYVLPVIAGGNVYLMYTHAETTNLVYKNQIEEVKTCFGVGGQICREKIQVLCSGHVEFIFAELHPVALYYLYKCSLRIFTDHFTPINRGVENEQTEKIVNATDIDTRLSLFRNFLETHLPMHQILKDNIFCLTQWIEQREGQVSVAEMAHLLGVSERQLQRIFLEKMGISPKYYAKLVQMRQAINLVMAKGYKQLTEVVYDKGHYDAAHFNKDFRRLLNMNPTEFIQQDAPLMKGLLKEELVLSV